MKRSVTQRRIAATCAEHGSYTTINCGQCVDRQHAQARARYVAHLRRQIARYSWLLAERLRLKTDHKWQPPRTAEYEVYWRGGVPGANANGTGT